MVNFLEKFIIRILGHKHLKFYDNGIKLFEFPMFLLPVKIHHNIIKEQIKNVGESKTKEIYQKIGKIQGNFAVKFFKSKFNIYPNEKDYSFYLEQIASMGLGTVKFEKISEDKSKFILKASSSEILKNSFIYDYYFEGIVLGGTEGLYNMELISEKVIKKNNQELIFRFHNVQDKVNILNENYKYQNIISNKKNLQKNKLYERLKNRNKKIFEINNQGVKFNNEKYFFTLMSVLVSIYYYSIITNKSNKEIFLENYKLFAKKLFKQFASQIPKTNATEFFNLLSLTGLGKIKIEYFSKEKFRFQIPFGKFEMISKKLFTKEFDIENNDLKIGFILGIYESLIDKENLKMKIIEKTQKKLTIEIYL